MGPRNDVYLALTKAPGSETGEIGLRVIIQPLIMWLWIGGMVMVAGTALSLFPGRRRNPLDPVSAPVPSGRAAEGAGGPDTDPDPDPDGDHQKVEA